MTRHRFHLTFVFLILVGLGYSLPARILAPEPSLPGESPPILPQGLLSAV
ncbi:MAG: hypothetical protein MUO62_06520 [Anaerolineales bacterium]|nr:hypothetical protein [Anaerolineales bacterium]